MFYGGRSDHHQGLCGGYDPISLEGLAQGRVASVHDRARGSCDGVPTMVFSRGEASCFTSPHNDPLVVEMKVASTIVRRIFIDARNSVDIIT